MSKLERHLKNVDKKLTITAAAVPRKFWHISYCNPTSVTAGRHNVWDTGGYVLNITDYNEPVDKLRFQEVSAYGTEDEALKAALETGLPQHK